MNPTPFSLSCLHVISTLTSHLSCLDTLLLTMTLLFFPTVHNTLSTPSPRNRGHSQMATRLCFVQRKHQQSNTPGEDGTNHANIWLLAMQQYQIWYHHYNPACKKQFPWHQTYLQNMATTYFFAHSAHKWQQWFKDVSSTIATTNTSTPQNYVPFAPVNNDNGQTLDLLFFLPVNNHDNGPTMLMMMTLTPPI